MNLLFGLVRQGEGSGGRLGPQWVQGRALVGAGVGVGEAPAEAPAH